MRITSREQLQKAAAEVAVPEPPAAPPEPAWRPRAIRRYFEVQQLEDGRPVGVTVRRETLSEAREVAARRAVAANVDLLEALPWEHPPADTKSAVILRHICFDECDGGSHVTDPALLWRLYPEAQALAFRR